MRATNTTCPNKPDRRATTYARVASQDHREQTAGITLQLDALSEPQAALAHALGSELSSFIGKLKNQEGANNG